MVCDAGREERGGATSVEMALLWSAMLTLILAVVQVALVFYAGQLALTAAQDGLRSGRAYQAATADAARRDAQAFLDRAAGSALLNPDVTAMVEPATGTLRVTVTGDAPSLLPGFTMPVSREAVGGIERVGP
ncbi:TadE family protein [Pseudonocardia lacus]|uniref:TadE family protein n=1 Tax=Pseudonocardia lacus TaxID=2835865 RepID=UPI0027E35B3A|nr:pilus assembly protein [Pseudonocardia lacus]